MLLMKFTSNTVNLFANSNNVSMTDVKPHLVHTYISLSACFLLFPDFFKFNLFEKNAFSDTFSFK